MGDIAWPKTPFYLMSKVGLADYVLTFDPPDGALTPAQVVLRPLTATIDQLWVAIPDQRGGAQLKHVNSGLALGCSLGTLPPPFGRVSIPVGPVVGEAHDQSKGTQLWVLQDEPRDNWQRVTSLLKTSDSFWAVSEGGLGGSLSLGGWDDAGPDDFKCIEETGQVTVTDVTYDLASATSNLSVPPVDCDSNTYVNNGDTPMIQTVTLERTITESSEFTTNESDTTATKYTQTFEVTGDFGLVNVKASAQFEESKSTTQGWSTNTVKTNTDTTRQATQINVPAGKTYEYHIVVSYGKVNVPYKATLTFQSSVPDKPKVTFPTEGFFNGLNATNTTVVVTKVTGPTSTTVKTVHVPRGTPSDVVDTT